jgi:hypothetical protein
VRRATRAALRTLDLVALDDLPFPAPVGGWWENFACTTGTRIPRALVDIEATEFLADDYYPEESFEEYPDPAELTPEAWSRFDYEDDDDFDYALDVQGDAVQDQIGDYLEARDLYGSEELHPGW